MYSVQYSRAAFFVCFEDFLQICEVIQMHQENENEAVQIFLIKEIDRDIEKKELSFVESFLHEGEAQQKKRAKESKYCSTANVTPMSSICELTNSISKHIMLMVVKLNPDLWDKKTVNAVVRKKTEHESSVTNTP